MEPGLQKSTPTLTPDARMLMHEPTIRALRKQLGKIETGRLELCLPDGSRHVFCGDRSGPEASLKVTNPRAVWRILSGGDIGLAEAYMAAECESPCWTSLIELGIANEHALESATRGSLPARVLRRLVHRLSTNTRRGSRRNISYHYDLGNDFYAAWLDPSMTYSCAVFEPASASLEEAQTAKYGKLMDLLDLRTGQRVLEIGCGWGSFACRAAIERGARVTALTISPAQFDAARKRVCEAGLNDAVEVRMEDYREPQGRFDAVVSIEMIEAVGESYWPEYFGQIARSLEPGGRAAIQAITIAEERFAAYRTGTDFIQRWIFPGSMLPDIPSMKAACREAGMEWVGQKSYGEHYARTLATWRERFQSAWPSLQGGNFDDRFRRMWSYYLSYCEAGFRRQTVDVVQALMTQRGSR